LFYEQCLTLRTKVSKLEGELVAIQRQQQLDNKEQVQGARENAYDE